MTYSRISVPNLITTSSRALTALMALFLMLLGPAPLTAHQYELDTLTLLHPYLAPTPPGITIAAGYIVLVNAGDTDDTLLRVEADFAERVEIHQTSVVDDVARMRELPDGLPLPANETVLLVPGGTHLMFVGLSEPLVLGQSYQTRLTFANAGTLSVEFKIEKIGSAAADATDHSNH